MSAAGAPSPARRRLQLVTILGGLFALNVTFTVFVVALPSVAAGLHSSVATLTWVVTGPLLAFAVGAPLAGKVGDVFGHRALYLWGLVGGAVCAAASAAAPDAGFLIVARSLGGLEGAATGAASMALLFRAFGPEERVGAMGWWSLVGAGGPVLGVALGAPIIEALGWRWLFVGQVPLVLAALVLAAAVLPPDAASPGRTGGRGLDWRGAALLTVGVAGALFALNRAPVWGYTSAPVLLGFGLFPLAAGAFVVVERRAEDPILPLGYLRRRNFTFPIAAMTGANFAYMGGFILAPLLLEQVFHQSEAEVGFVVIARPLVFSLSAPLAGLLTLRVGERAASVLGGLAVAASMLVFASLGNGSPDVAVIGALALSGLGLGLGSPPLSASVANAVEERDFGVASAAQQLMSQIGVVAGIQVMATLQASAARTVGLVGSFRHAYLAGAAVALAGVVAALWVRDTPRAARTAAVREGAVLAEAEGPGGVGAATR